MAMAQWGTTVEGKAEEITSQTPQAALWELLVVLRKENMGTNSENLGRLTEASMWSRLDEWC